MKSLSKGLMLAEVVLAVGFLTIIAITVAGVFTHLLNASAKTTDLTAGRSLARRVLDRAVRAGPDQWGFGNLTTNSEYVPERDVVVFYKNGTQTMVTQASESQTEFAYRLEWFPIKDPDDAVDGINRWIYGVNVEVTWWGTDPTQSRAEMGRLSTKVGQVARYN